MQIIWLKAFVALAEQMNFSDAAEEIFVSQSSLSKYIQSLEKAVGLPLFDRTKRRVELTSAGAEMYRYAIEIVSDYDEMMQSMQKLTGLSKQRVRVAAVSAILSDIYGFANIFYEFRRSYPNIEFELREREMCDGVRSLETGSSDFAIVRTNLLRDPDMYHEIRFNTEPMYLLCAPNHPLVECGEVHLEQILKEKLVLQRFAVDEVRLLFQKHNLPGEEMNICLVSTRRAMIREYIRSEFGVSVISRTLASDIDPKGELSLLPISEKPEMTLGMLIPKGPMSVACRNFEEFIRKEVSKMALGNLDNRIIP